MYKWQEDERVASAARLTELDAPVGIRPLGDASSTRELWPGEDGYSDGILTPRDFVATGLLDWYYEECPTCGTEYAKGEECDHWGMEFESANMASGAK